MDPEDPAHITNQKWWPGRWPLWLWQVVFVGFAVLIMWRSATPLDTLVGLVTMWVLIFGSIYGYRYIKNIYIKYGERRIFTAQKMEAEYHGLSPEEIKIWNELKNKLDK